MKYPAVFRDTNTSSSGDSNQQTVLIYQDGDAIHLTGKFKGQYTARWSTFNAINITREYLANTWGVVESKEHAEFIIELAKNAGFTIGIKSIKAMCFEFSVDSVNFYEIPSEIFAHNDESKQITIPLPPKSDINEAGHNLVFATPERKEWPCVNDRVTWGNKVCSGTIKAIDGNLAWIKNEHGNYVTEYIDKLQKPKTPEDALRDDIEYLRMAVACDHFIDKLLQKYNITPKD